MNGANLSRQRHVLGRRRSRNGPSSCDQGFCFHLWASNARTGGMYDVVVWRTSETLLLAISEMYAWRTRTIHDLHEPQPKLSAPTTMPRRIPSLRWNVQPSAIAESTLRSRGRPFKHL